MSPILLYRLMAVFLVVTFLPAAAQRNANLMGRLTYSERLSDIWGFASNSGNEYAIIGTYSGVSIVDVTDGYHPQPLFLIPGPPSSWRDIKTWQNHAYVVNETGGGLLIITLDSLPVQIDTSWWRGDSSLTFSTAHNLFIDAHGYAYLFGFNDNSGSIPTNMRGALILDLSDPLHPVVAGQYTGNYVHDGFLRNDTMWTAEIYAGQFAVVDVHDKQSPVILASMATPSQFTHNCWLSDDSRYLFTTDEKSGATIAAYDVRDLSNITLLDEVGSQFGVTTIPHNVFYRNGYLIASYYKDGIAIYDASVPDNLIQTGFYDTSPLSGDGFDGCWGVYPYLPSGKIIASDISEGLFVIQPDYQRAARLTGTIADSISQRPIPGVQVEIIGYTSTHSGLTGEYKTGIFPSGRYDIRFYKGDCQTLLLPAIKLQQDSTTILNATLLCNPPTPVDFYGHSSDANQPEDFTLNYHKPYLRISFNSPQPMDGWLTLYDISGRCLLKYDIRPDDRTISIYINEDNRPYPVFITRWSKGKPFTRKIWLY